VKHLTLHISFCIFAVSSIKTLISKDYENPFLKNTPDCESPSLLLVFDRTLSYGDHKSGSSVADYIGQETKTDTKDQNHEQAQKIFALTANCKRSRINYREVSNSVMLGADPTPGNVWSVYRKIKNDET